MPTQECRTITIIKRVDPTTVPTAQAGISDSNKSESAAAGLGVGIALAIALLGVAVWLIIRWRRRRRLARTLALLRTDLPTLGHDNSGANRCSAPASSPLDKPRDSVQSPSEAGDTGVRVEESPAWATWRVNSYLMYDSSLASDSRRTSAISHQNSLTTRASSSRFGTDGHARATTPLVSSGTRVRSRGHTPSSFGDVEGSGGWRSSPSDSNSWVSPPDWGVIRSESVQLVSDFEGTAKMGIAHPSR